MAVHLAEALVARFPDLRIAGTHSPPFRPMTEQEDAEIVRAINESGADIVWVGLGSPKQEQWMAAHRDRLDVPVLVGVGAAFDWLSGQKKRAPMWMQKCGLEWLHRLISEPRRLWRRYILVTPRFIPLAIMQVMGLRNYQANLEAGRKPLPRNQGKDPV